MFRSSHFSFLVNFGDKVTKIWKQYVIFVYILQDKMDKTENHATEVTKIPKTKRRKYGMKETIEFGKFLPKSKQIQRKIWYFLRWISVGTDIEQKNVLLVIKLNYFLFQNASMVFKKTTEFVVESLSSLAISLCIIMHYWILKV